MSINSILGDEFGKNLLSSGDTLIAELEKEGILIFNSFASFCKSKIDLEFKKDLKIKIPSFSSSAISVSPLDKKFFPNSSPTIEFILIL